MTEPRNPDPQGDSMTFGLASFGTATGVPVPVADVVDEYSEDRERILAYQYRNVMRATPEVGLTDLAVEAGSQALATGDTSPADIDLVVLAITDIAEYLYWDPAADVAHRLGCDRAEAVMISQACTSGVVSLDTVAGRFATHPQYQQALVVAANRTCETYWNRLDTQPMVFSDGAAATLARRDHPRLRWLATETATDGRYAGFYRLEAGGAATPFGGPELAADALQASDAWSVLEFFDCDADRFEAFADLIEQRTCEVVDLACARAGCTASELARLVMLSDNSTALTATAKKLGVPIDRTNLELALEYGHLGAADQFFCPAHHDEDGDLCDGDRVALVSRGRGMHWGCTILQV
jgi:3-oxoacyl-[acyl-carrier-protein] synthase-3